MNSGHNGRVAANKIRYTADATAMDRGFPQIESAVARRDSPPSGKIGRSGRLVGPSTYIKALRSLILQDLQQRRRNRQRPENMIHEANSTGESDKTAV